MKSVIFPVILMSIGMEAFSGCSGLASIALPDCITSIGDGAFEYCHSLTSVTIPNGVATIGKKTFNSCVGLSVIMIGRNVSHIGSLAFADCPELTDVFCLSEKVPSITSYFGGEVDDAFMGSYIEYATLHVPASSIESYRTKEPWKSFKDIVVIDEESAISGIVFDKTANATVYDLNGRKLQGPSKGINIIGSKKKLVTGKHP